MNIQVNPLSYIDHVWTSSTIKCRSCS